MKRLQCEICGSTDIIKQNGVFVCQSCGIKYSLEEAKKMMIDGVVEVTGSVGIDKTTDLKKWFSLARRAKSSNDIGNASKYYTLIYEQNPSNWESWFYSQYFRLFLEQNNSNNFANEIHDIFETMWQQVEEQDRNDTIKDILVHLNELPALCQKVKYEKEKKNKEEKRNRDFEYGLFNLVANSFSYFQKRTDNYGDQLISLAMSGLKIAETFSTYVTYGSGYEIFKNEMEGDIRYSVTVSKFNKEQWTDTEFKIINFVDFLIENKIEPEIEKDYPVNTCILGAVFRENGSHWVRKYKMFNRDELIWLGSNAIFENIVIRLNEMNSRRNSWEPKSKIHEVLDEYNKKYTELMTKATRIKPDFSFPNYYEEHPLPSSDEEIFAYIKKDLQTLNEEYEKNFCPDKVEETLEKQISDYNFWYKRDYENLMRDAKEIDPHFTFPNLLEINPITIDRFVNNNSSWLENLLGKLFLVILGLAI